MICFVLKSMFYALIQGMRVVSLFLLVLVSHNSCFACFTCSAFVAADILLLRIDVFSRGNSFKKQFDSTVHSCSMDFISLI